MFFPSLRHLQHREVFIPKFRFRDYTEYWQVNWHQIRQRGGINEAHSLQIWRGYILVLEPCAGRHTCDVMHIFSVPRADCL